MHQSRTREGRWEHDVDLSTYPLPRCRWGSKLLTYPVKRKTLCTELIRIVRSWSDDKTVIERTWFTDVNSCDSIGIPCVSRVTRYICCSVPSAPRASFKGILSCHWKRKQGVQSRGAAKISLRKKCTEQCQEHMRGRWSGIYSNAFYTITSKCQRSQKTIERHYVYFRSWDQSHKWKQVNAGATSQRRAQKKTLRLTSGDHPAVSDRWLDLRPRTGISTHIATLLFKVSSPVVHPATVILVKTEEPDDYRSWQLSVFLMLNGRHTHRIETFEMWPRHGSRQRRPLLLIRSCTPWIARSSCRRYPTLTNDRWRSNGSRTHVLYFFADVRTRSRIETCRIGVIVTASIRTCASNRWLGIAFGKVSSLYWRLTHVQGLDRHIRRIRSNCSRWSRNDILNYSYMIDMSSCRHQIFQRICRRFLFHAFRLSFAQSFRFSWFFLMHKIVMIAQKYFLHVLRNVVSVRAIKCTNTCVLAQHISITGNLSCTSWSVWLNGATRIRTVFTSWFSLHVEFHLYWIHYCTYYFITCDLLFFLDRPSSLASDLMTTLHSKEAR